LTRFAKENMQDYLIWRRILHLFEEHFYQEPGNICEELHGDAFDSWILELKWLVLIGTP